MVSPISPWARDYVRSRATAVMQYRIMAERVMAASIDDDTLIATAGSRVMIFEDMPARIWEIQGSQGVMLGDTNIMVQNVQLSTPWSAPVLDKDDEIIVTFAPTQDTEMLNKRFAVISAAYAGELRATRRYSVKAVER